jgi:hypothetical protein
LSGPNLGEMCELLHTWNHQYFDGNNEGPLYRAHRLRLPSAPRSGRVMGCAIALPSAGVALAKRSAHGIDRNPRYETREEEPTDTNPDRKCAPKRLPRHDIAITNREAGDEGEIDRVAEDQPSTKLISRPRAT